MDKITKIDSTVRPHRAHSISLEDRSKIRMTGVEKVVSSTENLFSLLTSAGGLTVSGKNMKINMYNMEDGTFLAEGDVDIIKYSAPKSPLLKRMFK